MLWMNQSKLVLTLSYKFKNFNHEMAGRDIDLNKGIEKLSYQKHPSICILITVFISVMYDFAIVRHT